MPKVIIGFVVGVLVAVLVMQWLDSLEEPATPEPAELDPRTGSVMEPSPAADSAGTTPTTSAAAAGHSNVDDSIPESDAGDSMPTIAESAAAQDSTDFSTGQQAAAPAATPSPNTAGAANRSEYPPEIAEMIERSVDPELQDRYESDPREDSWAPYMEGLLAAYFAQKPELAQFYVSLIDCRTSVCSIHALGYGPDALTLWTVGTADLTNQPWFEFTSMSMNRRNPVPDVLAVVLILTKGPPT